MFRFWLTPAISLLAPVALVALTACGPAAQPRPEASPVGRDAAALQGRAAAGRPGAAPARRTDTNSAANSADPKTSKPIKSADRDAVPPLTAATMQRLSGFSIALKNAAHRDRAMDQTMRRYMMITRAVFHRLRSAGSAKAGSGSYDPAPAWRFQGQVSRDFGLLADHAGLLERHLGTLTGRSYDASRIALFRRIFLCIRRDTWLRQAHGLAWSIRSSQQVKAGFSPEGRVRLYRSELQMMRTSVRCSSLIASRRSRD